ncbi:hypothetical protein MMC26_004932 [Xylographa opegraphella]|nr:hypothetical protein [Xylographa opegraphella]
MTPEQRERFLNQPLPTVNPYFRSPSIRSSSRRRASRNHKLLFYPLVTILVLLLLALPVSIVFLAQAANAGRTFISPLVAFFVIAFCAGLFGAGVGVLSIRRKNTQLNRRRKLEREAHRWRMLARERGREIEILRAVGERLRGRSRVRRRRDDSMSRAWSESMMLDIGSDEEEVRSVSRGRTGRGTAQRDLDTEDEIAELDGLEIRMTRTVPETATTKGNVGRAKRAAYARLRGEAIEKPLPSVPENPHSPSLPPVLSPLPPSLPASSPLPPLPTQSSPSPTSPPTSLLSEAQSPSHPPRRVSIGWLPRYNSVKALHFRNLSHGSEATSPPPQWRDSQTLISSPLQPVPGRLQESLLLSPPEPVIDGSESPDVQTTVLDRYVVPEQYRQALERQQELQHGSTQLHEALQELSADRSDPAAGEAESQQGATHEWGPELRSAFDTDSSEEGDEEDSDEEIGAVEIARGGNGGCGDAQSDENFEESHALEEDATSLTESLRRKKTAESLRKVASWEDGTEVAAAGADQEAAALISDTQDSISTTESQEEGSTGGRSLGIGRLSNRMKDEEWEIQQRRRNFETFLETKRLQSKASSGSERGEPAGLGVAKEERTL